MSELPPAPVVEGVSLSSDTPFMISREEDGILCRSVGVEASDDGTAHPAWFYIATQVGMGMTVAALCEACDFDVADGPLLTGSRVTFSTAIRTETPYYVEGEIKGLVRKHSRTLGVMDLMEYELRLVSTNRRVVLATTSRWALPRRSLV